RIPRRGEPCKLLETLDLLLFFAFAAVAILLPGTALQRLLRVEIDSALVVPLGTAFCAGAYWLSLRTGVPALFPLLLAVLVATAWLTSRVPLVRAPGPPLRGALAPALGLWAVLGGAQYPLNRVDHAT